MKIKIKYPSMSEQQTNEVMSVLREHCRKYNASYKFSIGEPAPAQATGQATEQVEERKEEFSSLMDKMTNYADLIQLTHLKMQQLVATAAPNEYAINFEECVYLIHFTDEESRVRHILELMAKLDAEGWKNDFNWNEARINYPDCIFLKCYEDGEYFIINHDCNFKEKGFPLHHWCGANPTKHRPKVKVGDRVVATTDIVDIINDGFHKAGYLWKVTEVDKQSQPVLFTGLGVGPEEGYRLATQYDL